MIFGFILQERMFDPKKNLPSQVSGPTDANALQAAPDPQIFVGEQAAEALGTWFEAYRPRLEKIVAFRMDPSFKQRLDPTDVVQESFFEISRRIGEFASTHPVPLFVWIRQRVLQTLIDLQRSHAREKRSVHRELRLPEPNFDQSTSLSIARILMDDLPSPSQAAILHEEQEQLRQALEAMNETDREVLALRHFEHLTNSEVGDVLGISPTAASNRYVRAAAKLSEILKQFSHRGGNP